MQTTALPCTAPGLESGQLCGKAAPHATPQRVCVSHYRQWKLYRELRPLGRLPKPTCTGPGDEPGELCGRTSSVGKPQRLCQSHNQQRKAGVELRIIKRPPEVKEVGIAKCTAPGREPDGSCHNIARTSNPQLLCLAHKKHLSNYGEFRPIGYLTTTPLVGVACVGTTRRGRRELPCDRDALYEFPFPMCQRHKEHYNQDGQLRPITGARSKVPATTRNDDGHKLCPDCEQWLPEDSFGPDKKRQDGLKALCRPCVNDRQMERLYGITREQYDGMLAEQGGVCYLCRKTQKIPSRRLAIDHDHACCPGLRSCGACVGKLLCDGCNTALGNSADKEEWFISAADYITEHRRRSPIGLVRPKPERDAVA